MSDKNLISVIENFTYGGSFALLLGAGYVVPIPVEIILLTIGYVGYISDANLIVLTLTSIAGLLAGDLFIFSALRGGSAYVQRLLGKHKHPGMDKYNRFFARNAVITLLCSRFFGIFRIMIPSIAVSAKMRPSTFFFLDIISITLYSSLLIFLGVYFHKAFLETLAVTGTILHSLFFVALALLGYAIHSFQRSAPRRGRTN